MKRNVTVQHAVSPAHPHSTQPPTNSLMIPIVYNLYIIIDSQSIEHIDV